MSWLVSEWSPFIYTTILSCYSSCRLRNNEKRKALEQGGPDAKISRGTTPAGADSSANNTPTRTPTPTPLSQPQGGGGDLLSQLLSGNLGSGDLVTDTQRIFEALVKGEQTAAVEVRHWSPMFLP